MNKLTESNFTIHVRYYYLPKQEQSCDNNNPHILSTYDACIFTIPISQIRRMKLRGSQVIQPNFCC